MWLFTLQTMFGQFDVNGSGSISAAQCKSGAYPDNCPSLDNRAWPRICSMRRCSRHLLWTEAVCGVTALRVGLLPTPVCVLPKCTALQNMGIEASEMPEISEPSYTGEAFLALACVTIAHLGHVVHRSIMCTARIELTRFVCVRAGNVRAA